MKVIANREEVVKRIQNCRSNKMVLKDIAKKYDVSIAFVRQAVDGTLPTVTKHDIVETTKTKALKLRSKKVPLKDICEVLDIKMSHLNYLLYGKKKIEKISTVAKKTSNVSSKVSVSKKSKDVTMSKDQVVALAEALLVLAKSL